VSHRLASVVLGLQAFVAAQLPWQLVASAGPAGRSGHTLAYDFLNQRTLLFGGANVLLQPLGDLWSWDGTTWTPTPPGGPGPRSFHAAAFDSQRGRLVVFGGGNGSLSLPNDTWEWDGASWFSVPSPSAPQGRRHHAMVYDSSRARTVLFGGQTLLGGHLGDTWEWDGVAWSQVASSGPAARSFHAMAYDPARMRTVLFGGGNGVLSLVLLGDTWEWSGTAWTQATNSGPPARQRHSMTYDWARGRTLLVGGQALGQVLPCCTWQWDGASWLQINSEAPGWFDHAVVHDVARQTNVAFGGDLALADTWELALSWSEVLGSSCGPTALALAAGSNPSLGTTATAVLTGLPTTFAFMAVGFDNLFFGTTPLPLPLDFLGMTGCQLQQSADIFGLGVTATSPTTATFQQPLPLTPAFVGADLYLQAFVIALLANPAQLVASNALHWHIAF
jgi:hypothetical protein